MAKKITIYTFIDAFGYEIYRHYPDFLKDVVTNAKPLKSVLGFTNTCLPSILSGQYPQEHKQASPLFFIVMTHRLSGCEHYLSYRGFFDRFRVRNILSKIVKKSSQLYGLLSTILYPI